MDWTTEIRMLIVEKIWLYKELAKSSIFLQKILKNFIFILDVWLGSEYVSAP